ncbi:putative nuclease HARBI1 isoform X1 [Anoplophora glabripennis]|uniref:putative nuclease HARBI1 isoform X1 n=2 Tax=Anoplophora glabripennis TaxID=217634 RepID=UPI000874F3B5|nr:putative nuclease HARBI1 isoform X1 [Anoplophora glabripennis]
MSLELQLKKMENDEFYEDVGDDVINILIPRFPKRYLRNYENPLEFYDECQFQRRYRFSKDSTIHILFPLVETTLQTVNNRGLPIPPLLQLLTGLRFYATGSFQLVCGDLRGISQATVCRIIRKISIHFAELLGEYIKFPQNMEQQRANIALFFNIAGFPSVAGCVDGTHIPIASPGGNNAEVYRNRKGYFSLNVQVIAGPRREILDIVVRHPGSTHDSVIFDRSSARVRFELREIQGLLLGDNGYPHALTL